MAEGEKICQEIFASTWEMHSFYCTPEYEQAHKAQLSAFAFDIQVLSAESLRQAGTLAQNEQCLAVVKMPPPPQTLSGQAYTLVLDHLQDPGNLGTILRLADWYGLNEVICSPGTVDVYHPKAIAASMGSFLRVRAAYQDLPAFLTKESRPRLGALLQGQNLHQFAFPPSGVLVLGNESQGISPEVARLLDTALQIPRFGGAESLNVAMATAIFCDHIRRQVRF
ncbi:MAG: RNA methyltransferase [Microscillaceae bacterium]|nr:RNA methyltransferase [Microscillaceae bacterium]